MHVCMYNSYIACIFVFLLHFTEDEIDGKIFLDLTDEEINGISKKLGIRKKLKQLQVCM